MTRKRFIKLVMSHGVSRNRAIKIAKAFNANNVPYERAYRLFKSVFLLSSHIVNKFSELSKSLSYVTAQASVALKDIAHKFKEVTRTINEEVE